MSKADEILSLVQDGFSYADYDKKILANQCDIYAKQLYEALIIDYLYNGRVLDKYDNLDDAIRAFFGQESEE